VFCFRRASPHATSPRPPDDRLLSTSALCGCTAATAHISTVRTSACLSRAKVRLAGSLSHREGIAPSEKMGIAERRAVQRMVGVVVSSGACPYDSKMAVATDVSVSLSGTYIFPTFDRLLSQLAPLLELDEPRPLHLDMSGVSFIGPTAIAVIQACLRRVEAESLIDGGWFRLPRNELTRRYLLRMDLLRRLKAFVDPEETFHRREPIAFRPLAGFEEEESRIRVVFDLLNALKNTCNVDALAEQSTFILLTELTENVLQHAEPDYGGFAAAQALKKKPTFEIGIVDLGIGIRRSLERSADLRPSNDVEAIQMALERGVTSNHPQNSGEGLFVTAEALKANGGDLLIRSGRGVVVVGAHERADLSGVEFPGTLVAFRARRDLPLDYHAVYQQIYG
jgi:hypothetical protein